MQLDPLTIGLIAAGVVLVVLVIAGAVWWRRRRWSREYGPEFDRLVERTGSRDEAIDELQRRKERHEQFDIRSLAPTTRVRFEERWDEIQRVFVDHPARAVRDAHQLISEAMSARGYPVEGEFERRAADLSIDHPHVVEHYRAGNHLALRAQKGGSAENTEDRRQAMLHFRRLFEELVEIRDSDADDAAEVERRSA